MRGRCLLVALSLCAAAAADELCYTDGTFVDGTVVSTTADAVTFKTEGGEEITVPASRLDPRSFYHLRNESVGDDANGRLALAKYAFDHRMYRQARAQFRRFQKIDPDAAEAFISAHGQEIHEGIAECLLVDAIADASSGNLPAAREHCTTILSLYHDTKAAEQAKTLLDTVQGKIDGQRAKAQAERAKRLDAAREEKLKQADEDLKWGDTIRNRALSKTGTEEKDTLDQAAHKYQLAIKRLEEICKTSTDETLKQEAEPLLATAKTSAVNCYVSNAQYYLSRGDYPRAKQEARSALALDPKCTAAQSVIDEANPDGGGDVYWRRPWRRRG